MEGNLGKIASSSTLAMPSRVVTGVCVTWMREWSTCTCMDSHRCKK